MAKKTPGNIFEECLSKSCPDYMLVKKLPSPASGWSGGERSQYTNSNECDFIMHDGRTGIFYGLELKSTKQPSITFWREDFEKEHPGTHFVIGKKQIKGLSKWDEAHNGVFGFVLNFREQNNRTFFVTISEFVKYTNSIDKKNINIPDIIAMKGIEISNKKLKTNYRYDMNTFFNTMAQVHKEETKC